MCGACYVRMYSMHCSLDSKPQRSTHTLTCRLAIVPHNCKSKSCVSPQSCHIGDFRTTISCWAIRAADIHQVQQTTIFAACYNESQLHTSYRSCSLCLLHTGQYSAPSPYCCNAAKRQMQSPATLQIVYPSCKLAAQ